MGGHPYWYFVDYKVDINQALIELREREFKAGRYNPVTWFPEFPITDESPAPGAKHQSIAEAMAAAAEDGTRSILDIEHVSEASDYCVASPFDPASLKKLYGTTKPTRGMLEKNMDYLLEIERGKCFYVVVYKNDRPNEILFAGYSFD